MHHTPDLFSPFDPTGWIEHPADLLGCVTLTHPVYSSLIGTVVVEHNVPVGWTLKTGQPPRVIGPLAQDPSLLNALVKTCGVEVRARFLQWYTYWQVWLVKHGVRDGDWQFDRHLDRLSPYDLGMEQQASVPYPKEAYAQFLTETKGFATAFSAQQPSVLLVGVENHLIRCPTLPSAHESLTFLRHKALPACFGPS